MGSTQVVALLITDAVCVLVTAIGVEGRGAKNLIGSTKQQVLKMVIAVLGQLARPLAMKMNYFCGRILM